MRKKLLLVNPVNPARTGLSINLRGIIDRKIKKDWFCQASLNFADDEELLSLAARSGCRMVFLGLEAETVPALEAGSKKLNLKMGVDSYKDIFRRIHRHHIAVLGAFIHGMDSDTLASLAQRTAYMLKADIDVMQTTFLTPLPGTRVFQKLQAEGRLLYEDFPNDWSRYDMGEVVFRPALMEPDQFSRAKYEANRHMYSSVSLWRKGLRTLRATWDPITAIWAYSSNLNYRNTGNGR